ncbi:hypothetical protein [Azohydromonas aeria]|uniref:hypothetical protein n=1 Tax=Azohydromonas aeria TaxID=2590212 RepID=UPI0012F85B79|nr:hypothetical protein [Azohydromonas aeria]
MSIGAISSGSAGSAAWGSVQQRRQPPTKEELLQRADTDGSGGVDATELQKLLAHRPGATSGTTSTGSSTSTSTSTVDFASLDGDTNGSLDATELDAAVKSLMPKPGSTLEFAQQRGTDGGPQSGGMPPPPPEEGADGSTSAGSSTGTTTTTYDPLDTNRDGVVSAQEQAAGELQDMVQDLLKAVDGNGDGTLDGTELSSLKDAMSQALQSAAGTSSSTPAAVAASSSSSSSTSAGSQDGALEEQAAKLVNWMLHQYASAGAAGAQAASGSQLNVSA